MVAFVIGFQATQNLDRVLNRGLVHVNLLEAPHQRAVFLKVVAELLVGGAADAAHAARGQRRLEQIGRIHRAAAGRASADHGMDFIDEQDRVGMGFKFRHHRLEPFLEIAAIASTGEQGPHIERENRRPEQHFRHIVFDDAFGQTFGNCGFTHARVPDIKRIVLGPAAQDLNGTLDFEVASDQRINLAGLGLFVEVGAVGRERVLRAGPTFRLFLAFGFGLARFGVLARGRRSGRTAAG